MTKKPATSLKSSTAFSPEAAIQAKLEQLLDISSLPAAEDAPKCKKAEISRCFAIGNNTLLAVVATNAETNLERARDRISAEFSSEHPHKKVAYLFGNEDGWLWLPEISQADTRGSYREAKTLKEAYSLFVDSLLARRGETLRSVLKERIATWNKNPNRFFDDDESQTRKNFLDPLLEALGYSLKATSKEDTEDVFLEATDETDGRPDYSVKVAGRTLFFVEAKKPKVSCKNWEECSQAVRYAWSRGNVPISLLSNFREFKVLLAKTNPTENNYLDLVLKDVEITAASDKKIDQGAWLKIVDELKYLSKEAALTGRFDTWLLEKGAEVPEVVPVSDRFLGTVNELRLQLAKGLAQSKSSIAEGALNSCVNGLLNRLIFVRVAEDRRILQDRHLWNRLKKWESRGKRRVSLIAELTTFFREIEADFNAGLFERNPELEDAPFSDDSIANVIESLYVPRTEYHFAVLRPEIIGIAYEQALAQKLVLTPAGKAKLSEKDDLQSENGIYYTPEYIVDYIVKNTVTQYLDDCGLDDNFRVADIACGSGAFLVASYRELLQWNKKHLMKKKGDAFRKKQLIEYKRGDDNRIALSIQARRELLVKHIFGIDVDAEACEKAKLGLFLVMMEDVLDFQPRSKALPNLDHNIVPGNSIFETDYKVPSEAPMYCHNPFDVFSKTTGLGGLEIAPQDGLFSIVVGNPPYINVEKLKKAEGAIEYLKKKYPNSAHKRTEFYCIFLDRALSLVKQDGYVGFITPDKWYYEPYGELLRKDIIESHTLKKLVIAGERVFRSSFRKCPALAAAITIIQKAGHDEKHETIHEDFRVNFRKHFKEEDSETEFFNRFSFQPVSKRALTDSIANNSAYVFKLQSVEENHVLSKMESAGIRLGELGYVNWGLRPKAQFLKKADDANDRDTFPLIKGGDVQFIGHAPPAAAVVYKARCMHPGRMGYEPLFKIKRLLISEVTGEVGIRSAIAKGGEFNDHSCSMFIRFCDIPKHEERLPRELKEVPDLGKKKSADYSYEYIAGILVSKLSSFYHAKRLSNELNVYPEHVRALRIPVASRNLSMVPQIEAVSKELGKLCSTAYAKMKPAVIGQVEVLQRTLDRLIYTAFDLTEEEVLEVENWRKSKTELPSSDQAIKTSRKLAA